MLTWRIYTSHNDPAITYHDLQLGAISVSVQECQPSSDLLNTDVQYNVYVMGSGLGGILDKRHNLPDLDTAKRLGVALAIDVARHTLEAAQDAYTGVVAFAEPVDIEELLRRAG